MELKCDLNLAKARLKQKWAKLTDDDLKLVGGKLDELMARIEKRTGETREAVENGVNEAYAEKTEKK